MSFEHTLDRLHAIVAALESDGLPLDDALRLFEEGVTRLRDAGGELDRVEAKLSLLVELPDGTFELADMGR